MPFKQRASEPQQPVRTISGISPSSLRLAFCDWLDFVILVFNEDTVPFKDFLVPIHAHPQAGGN